MIRSWLRRHGTGWNGAELPLPYLQLLLRPLSRPPLLPLQSLLLQSLLLQST